ncbi:glycosyl hydrolase family 65 protein [Streptomyces sp. NPDC096080]|uniref:glycoside hydrolase family 65 protein n=1 Tax=Streptomyces sp. NPDC096080 TaxID=3156693 RepID=UPI00332A88BF
MPDWTWRYEGYDPEHERVRETLCTLGNGRFATRGAAPETSAGAVHYPGTYAAGCYDRLMSAVGGRGVENEDLVNLPNWLPLRFRAAGGDWFGPDVFPPLAHEQVLDLRRGRLTRRTRLRDGAGRVVAVEQRRIVHMGDPCLAALSTRLTPVGWSGELEVESALDGAVTNSGVARYRELDGRHLTGHATGAVEPDTVWLDCRTVSSGVRVALAARTRVGPGPPRASVLEPGPLAAVHRLTLAVADRRPVTIDKTVALHTSRDPAIGDPLTAALDRVAVAADFAGLLASHTTAWAHLWRRAELDVANRAGHVLRLHLFHVLQTLSPHTADLDAGVPARGLHGEAYRGHVFWDELFVLPFLNPHLPEVSRALLGYRYRRLGAACRAAAAEGRKGAMFPWQSGSDGREETQRLHLNPRSGRWLPDHSRLQRHVGSAIAYTIWRYCEATGDTGFLYGEGAETLLQIARFWADSAVWSPAHARYRIRGVMGPDEYHDAYPGADRPGLDDNAYTNVTAAWVLARALDLVGALPRRRRGELFERIALDPGEPERWEDVSRRLRVPFHQGVVSQFDGYGDLAALDWDGYRSRYGDIRRLDRILEAEGDTVNRYQASKQADVLMLGYLFPPDELAGLFARLGHPVDDADWRATDDHYLARTSHGSTLSGLVHGWVLARAHRADAWRYVHEALTGDVADVQGGTTGEGIHLGAMAGTLDLVQRCLTGLEPRPDALGLDPAPLPQLSDFALTVRYRDHWDITLRLGTGRLGVGVSESDDSPLTVRLRDQVVTIAPGSSRTLALG